MASSLMMEMQWRALIRTIMIMIMINDNNDEDDGKQFYKWFKGDEKFHLWTLFPISNLISKLTLTVEYVLSSRLSRT